jgi:hypothetical protein
MSDKNIKNDFKDDKLYNAKVHRIGRITTFIVLCLFISIPLGVTIYSGLNINYKTIIISTLPLAIMMGITGAIEKMSMSPIMGPAAVYVSSTTGNVSNMKFPAAINAMNVLGCEQNTKKGEAIALIAVCASAFTTTCIILLGVLFLAPLVEPLLSNPYVKPAFDYMFPALMGAMVTPFILKSPKYAITPTVFSALAALILGAKYNILRGFLLPIAILLSIGAAYIIFKRDAKKQQFTI